jgi:hypothetical protein
LVGGVVGAGPGGNRVGDEAGNGGAGVHPHTNENTRKMAIATESVFFIVRYSIDARAILDYALRPTVSLSASGADREPALPEFYTRAENSKSRLNPHRPLHAMLGAFRF